MSLCTCTYYTNIYVISVLASFWYILQSFRFVPLFWGNLKVTCMTRINHCRSIPVVCFHWFLFACVHTCFGYSDCFSLCFSPFTVYSHYCDNVHLVLIGQCQSEVRAAAGSCIHWVSRRPYLYVLNLIVNDSIRVDWGEPVQLNSTSS